MTLEKLIKFIRASCLVQDKDNVVENDPNFLALTDGEIADIIDVVLSRVDPSADIRRMDNESLYPVVLLSKKEIYSRLAVLYAPKVNLKSDGDSITLSDKFNHYMSLIEALNKEYNTYLSTGTIVKSSEVYLDSRYYTLRHYNNTTAPRVNLYIDNVSDNYIDLSWKISYMRYKLQFVSYTLYFMKGETEIYNAYTNTFNENAKKIEFTNIHDTRYRLDNLVANVTYSLCLVVKEGNGLKGVSQQIIPLGGDTIG